MQKLYSIMQDFLRDPDQFFLGIRRDEAVKEKAWRMAVVALASFMVYGFMVGLGKSPLQAFSSSIKVPLLFLSTMLFCLPALYFFSLALLQTPLKMMQVLAVVLTGISVSGFLLLGLAPITLFFVLTSTNYEFFQLLAVAFVGLSASIGVYFLWRGMTLVETAGKQGARNLGRRILFLWILLYCFVGTQMTWRLSPFIGKPEDPFYLIKPARDNFYIQVVQAMQGLLNIPTSGAEWITPLITGVICILGIVVVFTAGGMALGSLSRQAPQKDGTQTDAPLPKAAR